MGTKRFFQWSKIICVRGANCQRSVNIPFQLWLATIDAPRGVGKTWLGLLIAKAVATAGHVGEWEAPESAKTLYIDGEMPADLMRDRDRGLGSGEVEFLNHAILFDRTEKVLNITETA